MKTLLLIVMISFNTLASTECRINVEPSMSWKGEEILRAKGYHPTFEGLERGTNFNLDVRYYRTEQKFSSGGICTSFNKFDGTLKTTVALQYFKTSEIERNQLEHPNTMAVVSESTPECAATQIPENQVRKMKAFHRALRALPSCEEVRARLKR